MALSTFTANGYKSGWVPSNQDSYDRFRNALMHGEDWSTGVKYFAIYWITFKPQNAIFGPETRLCSPLFENGPSPTTVDDQQMGHAERNLLVHLLLQLSVIRMDTIANLTILQSASPCVRCCREYETGLGALVKKLFPVTVVFSSFYSVQRPSCLIQNHAHFNQIDRATSDDTVRWLKKLKAANVFLRTTRYEDWKLLRLTLQLPDTYTQGIYNVSARKREDDDLQLDLKILMGR